MNTQDAADEVLHSPWKKALVLPIILSIVVSVVVLAFTWPTKTSEAKNLPVAITGPAASIVQVEESIKSNAQGVFDFQIVGNRDEAVQQIEEREVYGALILQENGAPEVLTAPAASTVASQMLNNVAQTMSAQIKQQALEGQMAQLQATIDAHADDASVAQATAQLQSLQAQAEAQKAMTATVTPVVSLSEGDPNGAALTISAFPLVLAGMIGGMAVMFSLKGIWRRLTAASIYAVLSGLAIALILHTIFGFVGGNFAAIWGTLILSTLGTALFILGISANLGNAAGAAIGAGLTMLVANPLSGASSPWQFTPEPWGQIGQWLIPGASTSLLRSISYFPDASVAHELTVLFGWVIFGVLLNIVGYIRAKKQLAWSREETARQ